MYIESMVIDKGTVSIRSPQALKITFYPNRTKLLPVVNRGRTYGVPTSHLGQNIDATNVVSIARAAYQYYCLFLDGAEQFFCRV